jgi:Succinate dehydrogenase/fumarate reductase, flavoprotein subunit
MNAVTRLVPESGYDFIVVGSGAAGLVGAISARLAGLRPLIIEKADHWGGTTAMSGGVLWIPANDAMVAEGVDDPVERARTYLAGLLGPDASERERAKAGAFLDNAPAMARMLAGEGLQWVRNREHPDYYPEVEGAGHGRTLEAAPIDGHRLGERLATLRGGELDVPALTSDKFGPAVLTKTGIRPAMVGAGIMLRHYADKLRGRKPLGSGRGLIASLMLIVDRLGIPVRLSTGLVDLTIEHGAVTGVVVDQDGRRETLSAPAGVLLAAGVSLKIPLCGANCRALMRRGAMLLPMIRVMRWSRRARSVRIPSCSTIAGGCRRWKSGRGNMRLRSACAPCRAASSSTITASATWTRRDPTWQRAGSCANTARRSIATG